MPPDDPTAPAWEELGRMESAEPEPPAVPRPHELNPLVAVCVVAAGVASVVGFVAGLIAGGSR